MRRGVVLFMVLALVVPLGGVAAAETLAPEAEVLDVVGPWPADDPEGAAFLAEMGTLKGVEIVYERLLGEDVVARVTGGDPPDLVMISQPELLRELAGEVIDLTSIVPETRLRMDYGDYLVDIVAVDGAVLGGPVKLDPKTLVWYRPDVFGSHGYAIPQTFTELVALSDSMVANGQTPWCHAMESGSATGWVGTDWIEDLVLGTEGPAVYDAWVAHDILFQDPRIESAFERYEQMINTDGWVFDRPSMLTTSFWDNAWPLGVGDCLMHRQAGFFAAAITSYGFDLGDFATFRFPSVSADYDDAMLGGGNHVAALNDRKVVQKAIKFMLSPKWGRDVLAPTAETTGWVVPNLRFNPSLYADELVRSWVIDAQAAVATGQFRFDGSDQMPAAVGFGTFFTGIVDLVAGTATVPEVLMSIDASWPS